MRVRVLHDMTELNIAAGVALPLDLVVQQTGILARTGAGKTNTAVVIAEEVLEARQQLCVLDPPGAWWGLRSSANGKEPGYPVIVLGGNHGDLPLTPSAGQAIADFVVDDRASVILDLSEFSGREMVTFVTAFAERLYQRKGTERNPMLLIIEEADEVAPQRPMPEQNRMLGAIERIVKRGRMRGIGTLVITQRSASLNKNVLSQIGNLIAMQTTAPQDIKAIDGWIERTGDQERRRELLSEIAELPIGTGFLWSPAWLRDFRKIHFRRRRTFDSSATPKPGQVAAAPKRLAEIDLEALRSRIAGTIEKAKADDPRELRRRIAELEKQVRSGQAEPEVRVERVEVPVLSDEQVTLITDAINVIDHLGSELTGTANRLARDLQSALERIQPPQHVPEPRPRPKRADFASSSAPVGAAPPSSIEGNGDADGGLSRSERALLQALARRYPAAATVSQLSTLSGRSAKSSTFLGAVSALTRAGHIERDGKSLVITEAGFDALGERPPAPMSPAEQIEMWRAALSRAERAIFEAIVERSPSEIRTEDIAAATGYSTTSSSFLGALSVLKRNGLVEADNGDYRLSAELRGGGA